MRRTAAERAGRAERLLDAVASDREAADGREAEPARRLSEPDADAAPSVPAAAVHAGARARLR